MTFRLIFKDLTMHTVKSCHIIIFNLIIRMTTYKYAVLSYRKGYCKASIDQTDAKVMTNKYIYLSNSKSQLKYPVHFMFHVDQIKRC